MKSVLRNHLSFPRNNHIKLESTCGRLVYRSGQAETPKQKLIHPSVFWYFQGFREKKTACCTKCAIVYPSIPSALWPATHDVSLPIRKPPQRWNLHEREPTRTSPEDETETSCHNVDSDFPEITVFHLIPQSGMNDLVRDLNFSKIQAKLLPSPLQGWNLLQQGVKVSYRKRQ